MAMDFSTAIGGYNTEYNLNAIGDYNKLLQGQAAFDVKSDETEFGKVLEKASAAHPIKDKNPVDGMGNFMDNITSSFGGGLNSVNQMKIEADRMQEDIAMGGSTSIHDAMIAAEKADLSMKMTVQIRNRILDAYTQLTQMAL